MDFTARESSTRNYQAKRMKAPDGHSVHTNYSSFVHSTSDQFYPYPKDTWRYQNEDLSKLKELSKSSASRAIKGSSSLTVTNNLEQLWTAQNGDVFDCRIRNNQHESSTLDGNGSHNYDHAEVRFTFFQSLISFLFLLLFIIIDIITFVINY